MKLKHCAIRVIWVSAVSAMGLMAAFLSGCGSDSDEADHAPAANQARAPAATNRLDIPPAARRNLGITFAKVELRPVRRTIRLPGRFEFRPKARREYNVMLAGRVELAVEQYQQVKSGDVLYRLESPEWRELQEKLAGIYRGCFCCRAEIEVAVAAKTEAEKGVEFLEGRIKNLAEANVRRVELEAELLKLRNSLPRLDAELRVKQAKVRSAEIVYGVTLARAGSMTGVPREKLDAEVADPADGDKKIPFWQTIDVLTIRAEAAGTVDKIGVTNRGWAETGDLVLDTLDPGAIRFHADSLQTDVNLFRDGLPAKIVPPLSGSIDLTESLDGTLTVGFRAHPDERTIPVYVTPKSLPPWAKAGVTAYLEVFVDGSDEAELAIPKSCVIRDGMDMVFFRRDPGDPDKVIRVSADLGVSDGRWIVVNSGVKAGDEIVLEGVYPLKLASAKSGGPDKVGHFHADGMFHEAAKH